MLTHFDAAAIAAQVPNPDVPGSGGLPQPRTALEAGFFIATARAQGIYSFWSSSPDTSSGNVTLHWCGKLFVEPTTCFPTFYTHQKAHVRVRLRRRTLGGSLLLYQQGETRCVLVSSATSTTETHMHANLEPCDAKMADGVLSVAAAAAPPPPPGNGSYVHIFDPLRAPPPPVRTAMPPPHATAMFEVRAHCVLSLVLQPSAKSHAWTIYKREQVFPLTEAVCEGRVAEGSIHRLACTKFLEDVGKWQNVLGVGVVAPLCNPVCWSECVGAHTGGLHSDGFNYCRQSACAASSCYEFLLRECDPILRDLITTRYKEMCSIVCLRACSTTTNGTHSRNRTLSGFGRSLRPHRPLRRRHPARRRRRARPAHRLRRPSFAFLNVSETKNKTRMICANLSNLAHVLKLHVNLPKRWGRATDPI